ncbi:DNA adenine methylase [Clostridium sp. 1001275B_160808_H3]|uniref:DNA adenine methylase n=1 Tax=Clostridium sp. 1001275B_160808_H3 TaxID=2787110 RepID=UPI001A9BDE7D|nr:DNA adenine methylase [Clostridium sp. 1001275B_160808_H3]
MTYIKSFLNYTGGKYKLLNQILPLFPQDIDRFVDLFCGGASVAINVNANKINCYDDINELIELFNFIRSNDVEEIIVKIEEVIDRYGLSETNKNGYKHYDCNTSKGLSQYNKEAYMRLRDNYNNKAYETNNEKILWFYTLIIFGFNNQIRFNKNGEFNIPSGKRDFNNKLREKLIYFSNRIRRINISFEYADFRDVNLDNLNENDFVYLDPPYLITKAAYNEQGGWTEQDEKDLLNLLDNLNSRGIRFALSNVFESKGKTNNILIEWASRYTVHNLNHNYNNSNYQVKDKSSRTLEVLICNY